MLRRVEVARDRLRLVRLARVEGAVVIGCVTATVLMPEALARSKDARGDLAAVRHEEFSNRHEVTRPRRARSLVTGLS